ncbi:hypothetical protein EV356DRAFT_151388 [Viridothelium virens]|uniref:LCCL domain-containing protein n=1 Tax=Viridothelium virens TaxID=1048519 RepID=A0A6A6H8P9_VIRVR|nr:hypothetical protein EV356DRAFT_151388 [Viridothelium virens]
MAAPASITSKDISGAWVLNQEKSGGRDAINETLEMQSVSTAYRSVIIRSAVTLHAKHYSDDNGEHIDIKQVASVIVPFLKTETLEQRNLTGKWRDHTDNIFGSVRGYSKRIKPDEYEDITTDSFMKSGWLPEANEDGLIQSYVENEERGWTADQLWGFEEIDGERRYVRHALIKKGGDYKTLRLVYDYTGPSTKW